MAWPIFEVQGVIVFDLLYVAFPRPDMVLNMNWSYAELVLCYDRNKRLRKIDCIMHIRSIL